MTAGILEAEQDSLRHVDWKRLAVWMEQRGHAGALTAIVPLAGGTQNLLFLFAKGERQFVLRRPPPTIRPESNETMRREARILAALSGRDVPHPRLLEACGDETVLGFAFYLMEPIEGFNATAGPLPTPHAADRAMRHQMGLSIVDASARLGRVDYLEAGLADFGKPDNYLERQVSRWRSQLDSYARYAGWPGTAELPGVDTVARYLEAHRPPRFRPGIIHGDYSLGNVMFRRDSGDVAAIVDWELATIGDPLIDLGWLLITWQGVPPCELDVLNVDPWDGFPKTDELVARYAAQSDRDLDHINWYAVLGGFKLAIILEGTYARACAGHDPMPTGLALHETSRRLLRRALHLTG